MCQLFWLKVVILIQDQILLSDVHKMYGVWKRCSVRKSWELRGKVQKNSMYLRPLPASSAPANTDAAIPPTLI